MHPTHGKSRMVILVAIMLEAAIAHAHTLPSRSSHFLIHLSSGFNPNFLKYQSHLNSMGNCS